VPRPRRVATPSTPKSLLTLFFPGVAYALRFCFCKAWDTLRFVLIHTRVAAPSTPKSLLTLFFPRMAYALRFCFLRVFCVPQVSAGQSVGHSSLRPVPRIPLTPPPQPFDPQFSPFPTFHLACRHSHAILSRVRRIPSPPDSLCVLCVLRELCVKSGPFPSLQRFNGPAPKRHSSVLESLPSQIVTLPPTPRPPKSFIRNAYGPPRKCCKQKTYGKPNSFRCNTYKKPGEGCTLSFTPFKPSNAPLLAATEAPSYTLEHPDETMRTRP
jgi:hypothetical protein